MSGSKFAVNDRTEGAHHEEHCQSLLIETKMKLRSTSHVIQETVKAETLHKS